MRLGGEIVSADSMQVYRGMDIGTAKPPRGANAACRTGASISSTPASRSRRRCTSARHGARSPTSPARHKLPIVAGGTGLYVRAALDDMEFPAGEQADNPVRERYEAYAAENGPEALHALLAQRDPESAAADPPQQRAPRRPRARDGRRGRDLRRAARGLLGARERLRRAVHRARRWTASGSTSESTHASTRCWRPGLLGEVRALLDAGLRDALTASQAIGYKEFVPVIEDGADLDEAVDGGQAGDAALREAPAHVVSGGSAQCAGSTSPTCRWPRRPTRRSCARLRRLPERRGAAAGTGTAEERFMELHSSRCTVSATTSSSWKTSRGNRPEPRGRRVVLRPPLRHRRRRSDPRSPGHDARSRLLHGLLQQRRLRRRDVRQRRALLREVRRRPRPARRGSRRPRG